MLPADDAAGAIEFCRRLWLDLPGGQRFLQNREPLATERESSVGCHRMRTKLLVASLQVLSKSMRFMIGVIERVHGRMTLTHAPHQPSRHSLYCITRYCITSR